VEGIKEKIKKITLNQWHIALIVLGIIFISLGAFHSNLWFDETYSVGIAKHSFAEIWTIGGNDVHPVLYYWMLHIIFLLTGNSIIAGRVFSIIPIAIMIILGYTHIRKDFGEKIGFIFSFLSTFLPVMALYAIEMRMYSWAILAVTILSIYAYRLSKEDSTKNWIIFGISSLVSIFLHYYGLMAAGLINIALLVHLIRNKRKTGLIFIISFGILQLITYIPWLMYFVTQLNHVSSGFWIGFEFPNTLFELLSSQLVGYTEISVPCVLALELYAYIIYKTYNLSKDKQDLKPFKIAVGLYFAVILAAVIMTAVLKTSILYYRYLFVITGLYIFAISFILGKENNKTIIVSILSVIAILGIYNNFKMVKNNYNHANSEPISYMKENIKDDDIIVFTGCGVEFTTAIGFENNQKYYYNKDNWGVEEAYKAYTPNFTVSSKDEVLSNSINRIWVIDSAYGDLAKSLYGDENRYKEISEKQFFTTYHNSSWKITLIETSN
jgi:4-amino-4-deoxy-L-arabinose transferase-like glycosyltransferase